jgi:hypothetical protein
LCERRNLVIKALLKDTKKVMWARALQTNKPSKQILIWKKTKNKRTLEETYFISSNLGKPILLSSKQDNK